MIFRSRLHLFSVSRKILLLWFAGCLTLCYVALALFDGSARVSQNNGGFRDASTDPETLRLLSEIEKLKVDIGQLRETLIKTGKDKTSGTQIQQESNLREANTWLKTTASLNDNINKNIHHGLNAHVWIGNCLKTLQNACDFPVFPGAPDVREIVQNFDISRPSHDFGQRVFGFLHPPASGRYIFAIASDDSSELWLSSDEDWRNSKLIASVGDKNKAVSVVKGDFFHFPNQKSGPILLEKGKKYFMEALHVEAGGLNFLQVAWQGPTVTSFESLNPHYLSTYFVDKNLNPLKMFDQTTPKSVSCRNIAPRGQRNPYFAAKRKPVYLEHTDVDGVLPTCSSYDPSYIVRGRKLKRWEAYSHMIHYSSVYPLPEYEAVQYPKWVKAKSGLPQREAERVVSMYMEQLERKQPGKYALKAIQTVELKQDKKYLNKRFFIELELMDLKENRTVVLSEYMQQPNNSEPLCSPEGLRWNKKADVYFVITAQNQGRWIRHFINSLERIYEETKDEHVHGVVFDYNSPDFDFEAARKRTSLPRVTIVRRPAKKGFMKTVAYNEAVSAIKDPNAIVYLMDLHLELASSVVDEIRKRTIQGKLSYTPILTRMVCGGNVGSPNGFWEARGFGLVGIYKSDWDRFGGFNIHKEGWGGEDWDIIDRIMESSMELERLRTPHVLHIHHSKQGMWQKS